MLVRPEESTALPPSPPIQGLTRLRGRLGPALETILTLTRELKASLSGEKRRQMAADVEKVEKAAERLGVLVTAVASGQSDDDTDTTTPAGLRKLRHDLRTPINHILGYNELLLDDAVELGRDDWTGSLHSIDAAARQALEAINQEIDPFAGSGEMAAHAHQPGDAFHSSSGSVSLSGVQTLTESRKRRGALRGNVLVVDDNPDNRDVLSRQLRREGANVHTAIDGMAALTTIETFPCDAILLDVHMPNLNGEQVLERLKANRAWREIPVIMISASDSLDMVVQCLELGAEDYLTKPFEPAVLRARVGACLERKQKRDREIRYLRDVAQLTHAANCLERGTFEDECLEDVEKRDDELGALARVFRGVIREVKMRESRLQQQVQALRIEIDETRKREDVEKITDTPYFQQLQKRVSELRQRRAQRTSADSDAEEIE